MIIFIDGIALLLPDPDPDDDDVLGSVLIGIGLGLITFAIVAACVWGFA